jgi:hypothetical protein
MISTLPLVAPVGMVMPAAAQFWMTTINWALVAVMAIVALKFWRNSGSPIGLLFLAGGALTSLDEPIVDVLGKCWFPAIGSESFLTAWGVTIPSYMPAVYAWYVGGQTLIAYLIFRRGIASRGVFVLYGAFAIVNIALEMPGLNLPRPMYTYFGNQPFVIAKFPLWWTFVNALMPLTVAGIAFRLTAVLTGWRQIVVVPLCWMIACATNGAIAAPVWVALNTNASTLALTSAAGVVSLGMGLLVCYGVSLLVAEDSATARQPASTVFARRGTSSAF